MYDLIKFGINLVINIKKMFIIILYYKIVCLQLNIQYYIRKVNNAF